MEVHSDALVLGVSPTPLALPAQSIYRTGVKKISSLVGRSGKWSPEEEEMLRQLVRALGQSGGCPLPPVWLTRHRPLV